MKIWSRQQPNCDLFLLIFWWLSVISWPHFGNEQIYPLGFLFTNEMINIYNVDNQICQIPLWFSFSLIYAAVYIYLIRMSMLIFIYFKLIRYVHGMNDRVTPENTLLRARPSKAGAHKILLNFSSVNQYLHLIFGPKVAILSNLRVLYDCSKFPRFQQKYFSKYLIQKYQQQNHVSSSPSS